METIDEQIQNLEKKLIKLIALREEQRKQSLIYDDNKIFVGVLDGRPYIMVGLRENKYFRFHSFDNGYGSESGWQYASPTGQECLDSAIKDGMEIHDFTNIQDALNFFQNCLDCK